MLFIVFKVVIELTHEILNNQNFVVFSILLNYQFFDFVKLILRRVFFYFYVNRITRFETLI